MYLFLFLITVKTLMIQRQKAQSWTSTKTKSQSRHVHQSSMEILSKHPADRQTSLKTKKQHKKHTTLILLETEENVCHRVPAARHKHRAVNSYLTEP